MREPPRVRNRAHQEGEEELYSHVNDPIVDEQNMVIDIPWTESDGDDDDSFLPFDSYVLMPPMEE